jgi:hypothetical protein
MNNSFHAEDDSQEQQQQPHPPQESFSTSAASMNVAPTLEQEEVFSSLQSGSLCNDGRQRRQQHRLEKTESHTSLAATSPTWMRHHERWLSHYVSYLVFGDSAAVDAPSTGLKIDNKTNPALSTSSNGVFLPELSFDDKVSLEDVCDEIVLTFSQH